MRASKGLRDFSTISLWKSFQRFFKGSFSAGSNTARCHPYVHLDPTRVV
ncbi:MAG: hypothetical protein JRD01_03530 [Deltaproteobacteria bacterium]|nr:hypothetical protein [Deltaproteobacteria bacterium]